MQQKKADPIRCRLVSGLGEGGARTSTWGSTWPPKFTLELESEII